MKQRRYRSYSDCRDKCQLCCWVCNHRLAEIKCELCMHRSTAWLAKYCRVEINLRLRRVAVNAVYRKCQRASGWKDYAENASNSIASAVGLPGVCPRPGSADCTASIMVAAVAKSVLVVCGSSRDEIEGLLNGIWQGQAVKVYGWRYVFYLECFFWHKKTHGSSKRRGDWSMRMQDAREYWGGG